GLERGQDISAPFGDADVCAPRADRAAGSAGPIRGVQDDQRFRQHGPEPRMARRGRCGPRLIKGRERWRVAAPFIDGTKWRTLPWRTSRARSRVLASSAWELWAAAWLVDCLMPVTTLLCTTGNVPKCGL